MADDEDDVPALVTVNAGTRPDPSMRLDTNAVRQRVPITIITGMHPISQSACVC